MIFELPSPKPLQIMCNLDKDQSKDENFDFRVAKKLCLKSMLFFVLWVKKDWLISL